MYEGTRKIYLDEDHQECWDVMEKVWMQLHPDHQTRAEQIKEQEEEDSKKEALAKVLSTGSATKERTSEDRIGTYAEGLLEDDIVGSKTAARIAAEAIEESGKGLGTFKKDPGAGDRKEG